MQSAAGVRECEEQLAAIEFHLLRIVTAAIRRAPRAALLPAMFHAEARACVEAAVALLSGSEVYVRRYAGLIASTFDAGLREQGPSIDSLRAITALLYAAAMEFGDCIDDGACTVAADGSRYTGTCGPQQHFAPG